MSVHPIGVISLLVVAASLQFRQHEQWQFFNGAFHPDQIVRIEGRFVNFQDTIPNDTLYVCFSKQEIPLAFYREIQSGVCLEGVCLPVSLSIYWTVSGNYLGYQLGEGEILTKNEHDPFTAHDYAKLHTLLSDPQSMLANYTLAEMAPEETKTAQVDGISGATIADIRGYIIQGAAYTTHTLWHIVYGPSRDSILSISSAYASAPLLDTMLSGSNRQDKIWALNQFKNNAKEFSALIPKIQETIKSEDFYIKEQAMNSLTNSAMSEDHIQSNLFEVFPTCDFGTKRMIINRLIECCSLQAEVVEHVVRQIPYENNAIANLLFTLLKVSYSPEPFLIQKVSLLLEHEKKFISEAAYHYLSSLTDKEPWLKEKLKEYPNKH